MNAPLDPPDFVDIARPDGGAPWRLALRKRPARAGCALPGIVWFGGFASDMTGTKASFLDDLARAQGRAYLRFDYSGHGESHGRFEDGCIGDWLEQSLAMFLASETQPQIVAGASMGAWIALLLARRLAALGKSGLLKALVLLAPATDFTQALIWPNLHEDARRAIMTEGQWSRPGAGFAPPITRRLIEEGRAHLLLGDVVRTHAPVHILQGMDDADVPWTHAQALMERLVADPATLTFIPGGDHRLSRPEDLALLEAAIAAASAS